MLSGEIKKQFIQLYKNQDFQEDGTLEIRAASFLADEPTIFGERNVKYIEAELEWYDSQSLNVNDLGDIYGKVPAIWKDVTANTDGDINSNYGYLIYSKENGSQYNNVVQELKLRPNSRRATMIYTNPDMHQTAIEHGKNDFVCTNAVTYYKRGTALYGVVQMRSNDAVFGYINDYAWQVKVINRLAIDLGLEAGHITWQVQNLHVYPRHFHLIEECIKPKDYVVPMRSG